MDPLRPDLVDLTQDQRRGLPRSVGVLGALLLITVGALWALAVHARPAVPEGAEAVLDILLLLLGIVAVSLAGVVGWLLTWAPRMLARQGIVADSAGLLLFQDAKWWFGGRSLHVPWSALAEVRDHRPAGLGARGGLVLHLYDLAPGAKAPGWAMIVPAGGLPPEKEEQSDQARLFLTLPASGGDELSRVIERRCRPAGGGPVGGVDPVGGDPFSGAGPGSGDGGPAGTAAGPASGSSTPGAVPVRPVADPAAAARRGPGRGGHPGPPAGAAPTVGDLFPGAAVAGTAAGPAGAHHAPGAAIPAQPGTAFSPGTGGASAYETWLTVRGQRIIAWAVLPVALVGTPVFVLASVVRGSDDGWGSTSALVLTAVVAAGMLVSAVLLPWYWAPQGVSGNEYGISVRRERMWWARGGGLFVPWADVHGVVAHRRAWDGSEESWGLPVVELAVSHLDAGARPPSWARTVPAGAPGWGTVADRPRLGITVAEPYLARRIELLVLRARPDLAEVSGPSAPSGGPVPGSAVSGVASGDPVGVPATASAAHATPVAARVPDVRVDQWIAVPRRGVGRALTALGTVAAVVALAFLGMADDRWFPALASAPAARMTAFAAIVLVCAAVLVRLVAVTVPRRLARSGIRISTEGLVLTREDLWWSRGSRVRLTWADVGGVRESRALTVTALQSGRPVERTVDVVVRAGRIPGRLPHWARARGGTEPGTVRVRLMVGERGRRRLLAGIRDRGDRDRTQE
jgi:hypothetical protein